MCATDASQKRCGLIGNIVFAGAVAMVRLPGSAPACEAQR